jgi:hypothetical protein
MREREYVGKKLVKYQTNDPGRVNRQEVLVAQNNKRCKVILVNVPSSPCDARFMFYVHPDISSSPFQVPPKNLPHTLHFIPYGVAQPLVAVIFRFERGGEVAPRSSDNLEPIYHSQNSIGCLLIRLIFINH